MRARLFVMCCCHVLLSCVVVSITRFHSTTSQIPTQSSHGFPPCPFFCPLFRTPCSQPSSHPLHTSPFPPHHPSSPPSVPFPSFHRLLTHPRHPVHPPDHFSAQTLPTIFLLIGMHEVPQRDEFGRKSVDGIGCGAVRSASADHHHVPGEGPLHGDTRIRTTRAKRSSTRERPGGGSSCSCGSAPDRPEVHLDHPARDEGAPAGGLRVPPALEGDLQRYRSQAA